MAKHHAFEYMHEVDYLKFYHDEIAMRKEVNYQPYTHLMEIEISANNEPNNIIDQLLDVDDRLVPSYPHKDWRSKEKDPQNFALSTNAKLLQFLLIDDAYEAKQT